MTLFAYLFVASLPAFWPSHLSTRVLWSKSQAVPFADSAALGKSVCHASPEVNLAQPRTFACWFRQDSIPEGPSYFIFVNGKKPDGIWNFIDIHQRKQYWFGGKVAATRGCMAQRYYVDGNPNREARFCRDFFGEYPTGTWHQVVLSSTCRESVFYLDGKRVSEIAHTAALRTSSRLENVSFGAPGMALDGAVIFDGALSADTIAGSYGAGRLYLDRVENIGK